MTIDVNAQLEEIGKAARDAFAEVRRQVSNAEFIERAAVVREYGHDLLKRIDTDRPFAKGGLVRNDQKPSDG